MSTSLCSQDVIRKGCKDMWNSHMLDGVSWEPYDMPFCPTTATEPPAQIITWDEAKTIYNKRKNQDPNFFVDAFVCYYIDDNKFDGPKGVWYNPEAALLVLRHFAGAITPDFSTYLDLPIPIKYYNTYRMRALGYYMGKQGIPVINNVRWSNPGTYYFSFAGLPGNSMVAIGTVGGSPRKLENRALFEEGLSELVRRIVPHTIIVYGSANYPCFDRLKAQGIKILQYPSKTAQAFARRQRHV